MRTRLFIASLFLLFATLGCDGCSESPCHEECPDGFACSDDGVCLSAAGCAEPCGPGEICASSVCIPEDGQCTEIGEICQVGLPTDDAFYCLDLDNAGPSPATCVERCDASGSCSAGGLCFFVSTPADAVCSSDDDCGEAQVCESGGCRDTVCLPSECDGFFGGAQTCSDLYQGNANFPNGGQCLPAQNDSYFCVPAGPQNAGDVCEDVASALQRDDFSLTCASGLACVDSVCRPACKADSDCPGDGVCLLEEQDFVDVGTGFCGLSCTPFELGSCGSTQTCFPVSDTEGTCIGAGSRQAFELCTPGQSECADGTLCVTFEQAEAGGTALARCQPWCNVAVAPAGDDGVVGDFEQAQRDATCPQPETPSALVAVLQTAQGVGAVDVYLGDEVSPTISDLAFGSSTLESGDYLAFDAGNYTYTVLPAGAPRTDPPLAEGTINLQSEIGKIVVLHPVAGASDEVDVFDRAEVRLNANAANADVRVVHASPDAGPVDVVLVPPGDDLSDPSLQVVIGSGLDLGDLGTFFAVTPGTYDLLVFPAGDPRTDRSSALVTGLGLELGATTAASLVVTGTVDENDAADPAYLVTPYAPLPDLGASGPRFTCVSTGDDVLGYCQQECGDDPAVFGLDLCEGDQTGCRPFLLPDSNRWRNLCGPMGTAVDGEACDPFATWGECAEGLTCQEYGNARPDFEPGQRGLCRPLCDTTEGSECGPERSCRPISYETDYAVGECGYTCEPGVSYGDPQCPDGLETCKPIASLQDPETGMIPFPQEEQPFCSASGTTTVGETCSGADCVAGSECMFPRSPQTGFVSTLVSQYFGAQGLTPTCTPQCNPFDAGDAPVDCADGETCLFNFPWSAEVGHCAEIVEDVAPDSPCSRPGESCGRDSICVVNGEATICLRFCEYVGDAGDGTVAQSTCPNGFQCNPFVTDIGICATPN